MAAKFTIENVCVMDNDQLKQTATELGLTFNPRASKSELLTLVLKSISGPVIAGETSVEAETQKVELRMRMLAAETEAAERTQRLRIEQLRTESEAKSETLRMEQEANRIKADQRRIELESIERERALELEFLDQKNRRAEQAQERNLQFQERRGNSRNIGEDDEEHDTPHHSFRVDQCSKLLPKWIETDVDTFLRGFERVATLNGWPENKYLAILQSSLSAKAQKILIELPADATYQQAKEKLLLSYEIIPETLRKRFRSMTKNANETHVDLAFNLNNIFKRWLDGYGAFNNLERMKEVLLLERFYETLGEDIRVFIADRHPETLQEAAQMADLYCVHHKTYANSYKSTLPVTEVKVKADSKPDNGKKRFWANKTKTKTDCVDKTDASQTVMQGVNTVNAKQNLGQVNNNVYVPNQNKELLCFRCKQGKHKQKDCLYDPKLHDKQCFNCHLYGHLKPMCNIQTNLYVDSQTLNSELDVQKPITRSSSKFDTTIEPHPDYQNYTYYGNIINDDGSRTQIRILHDSGSLQSLLSTDVLGFCDSEQTNTTRYVKGITQEVIAVPLVKINVESDVVNGHIQIGLHSELPYGFHMLLGHDLFGKFFEANPSDVYAVTRSHTASKRQADIVKPLPNPNPSVHTHTRQSDSSNPNLIVPHSVDTNDDKPRHILDTSLTPTVTDVTDVTDVIEHITVPGNPVVIEHITDNVKVSDDVITPRLDVINPTANTVDTGDTSHTVVRDTTPVHDTSHIVDVDTSLVHDTSLTDEADTSMSLPVDNPIQTLSFNDILTLDKSKLAKLQRDCKTLTHLFNIAENNVNSPDDKQKFFMDEGILKRNWKMNNGTEMVQILVPLCLRNQLLHLGHETTLTGHLGIRKTTDRLLHNFFWPKIFSDCYDFSKSCRKCQLMGKGKIPLNAPLISLPISDNPFECLGIDLIGPLPECKLTRNRFILNCVDLCTHFPVCIPLIRHDAPSVADALLKIFCDFGFPSKLISDRGTDLTSDLMQQVEEIFKIKHNFATSYHPHTVGNVERFGGCLKSILTSLAEAYPNSWDTCIPYALWAYRSSTVVGLGYSSYELLFGRQPVDPLTLLKNSWVNPKKTKPVKKHVLQYVSELREKMQTSIQMANKFAAKAKAHSKALYDEKAKERHILPGDSILLHIPVPGKPLSLKLKGPYTVLEQQSPVNYLIQTPDRKRKTFLAHVDLLRKFYERDKRFECNMSIPTDTNDTPIPTLVIQDCPKLSNPSQQEILTGDSKVVVQDCPRPPTFPVEESPPPDVQRARKVIDRKPSNHLDPPLEVPMARMPTCLLDDDVRFDECPRPPDDLTTTQQNDIDNLLYEYADIFSSNPGLTTLGTHKILIKPDAIPVKRPPYRMHPERIKLLEKELQTMLDLGLIRESTSEYASPCMLLDKPDGTVRLIIDYSSLNKNCSLTQGYPIQRIDDLLDQIGQSKFLSKLDFTKAYWNIELDPESIKYSAFVTSNYKQYESLRLSLGLCGACATFNRIVNKMFTKLRDFTSAYFDDVLCHTSTTWTDHLDHLRQIFNTVRDSGMTLNLSKCQFGKANVEFLGFLIGLGRVEPRQRKVQAILNFQHPRNSRQTKQWLGLVNYYSKFIPHHAQITAPLTDLLKKNVKFRWSQEAENAFNQIKHCMASSPILSTPDYSKQFYIACDASQKAISSCLFQVRDNLEMPIAFSSIKLTEAQQRMDILNLEALSLLTAVKRYSIYFNDDEIIVYTDSNPLTFIHQMSVTNNKYLRWKIILAPFKIKILHRPGSQNILPDILSRPPM